MKTGSTGKTRMSQALRILVLRDGEMLVAQCLEYDIGTQAPSMDTLRDRMECLIACELEYASVSGQPIDQAPEIFNQMWGKAIALKMDTKMSVRHWSSCAINSGPALFPQPCDCGGFKDGRRPDLWARLAGCTPVSALLNFRDLWQARIVWKRENRAGLRRFVIEVCSKEQSAPKP